MGTPAPCHLGKLVYEALLLHNLQLQEVNFSFVLTLIQVVQGTGSPYGPDSVSLKNQPTMSQGPERMVQPGDGGARVLPLSLQAPTQPCHCSRWLWARGFSALTLGQSSCRAQGYRGCVLADPQSGARAVRPGLRAHGENSAPQKRESCPCQFIPHCLF